MVALVAARTAERHASLGSWDVFMANDTLLDPSNLPFLEDLYDAYKRDPSSLDETYRSYFEALENEPRRQNLRQVPGSSVASGTINPRLDDLVNAFRLEGHLAAQLDPLQMTPRLNPASLDPKSYGFTEADLQKTFDVDVAGLPASATLSQVIEHLRATYCGSIGVEYLHVHEAKPTEWFRQRLESGRNHTKYSAEAKARILDKLTWAEGFESFLHKKYVGVKRFSLSGAETLVPMLSALVDRGAEHGVEEVVFGMAHRGRLNVLTNVLNKPPALMFAEFEHNSDPWESLGSGDVKYHMGYSSDYKTPSGKTVHLTMGFNPSHLEFINAVVTGRVRAKQERRNDERGDKVIPLLLHGDAAFMGQGVVMETLNLSQLEGYSTGGTIHVVVNNQIGFTTTPRDARSTRYCTEIAKLVLAPILHVNGDDPEACVHAMQLAADFRKEFARDIVIDLVCYRKYGHNEGDEPAFTQPLMYSVIREQEPVRSKYAKRLAAEGSVTAAQAEAMMETCLAEYQKGLDLARGSVTDKAISTMAGVWQAYKGGNDAEVPESETRISAAVAKTLCEALGTTPSDFVPHSKVVRVLEARAQMGRGETPFDWATGELLAMSSLLQSGTKVRVSGQDVRRGTFSSRHAVLFDQKTGRPYSALSHLSDKQGMFEIYDSPLSEQGVMGFEFGYSLDSPDALVIWEAQFGDFCNVAQVIIDQFITSSAEKWKRLCGMVLMLPHGYEGQGPEHSSARLERFLQLAAKDNMQVCNLTTPAQIFHALRRQVVRPYRKPLVIMSPKSLLRHPEAVSPLPAFTDADFQRVIGDVVADKAKTKRAILCSGKVFYDLMEERKKRNVTDVAIVRVEELYPFPDTKIVETLQAYKKLNRLTWVQEEPENQGAASFMLPRLTALDMGEVDVVARAASASPATGSKDSHDLEQRILLAAAFGEKVERKAHSKLSA